MRRAISIAVLTALAVMTFAGPASATVHEITGMFCSDGNGNFTPEGISGRSKGDNFAKPLFATGFIESVTPYEGGMLITFDFDHPASKLSPHPTLQTFQVGPATYISAFVLDVDHGVSHCLALR